MPDRSLKSPPAGGCQGLTARQQAFVDHYLVSLNASEAYKRAGYRAKNANVAAANASLLIRNHRVFAAIEAGQRLRAERVALDQDEVVRRLRAEADYHGPGRRHMARVRALELLARHLGMFGCRRCQGRYEPPQPPTPVGIALEELLMELSDPARGEVLAAMERIRQRAHAGWPALQPVPGAEDHPGRRDRGRPPGPAARGQRLRRW